MSDWPFAPVNELESHRTAMCISHVWIRPGPVIHLICRHVSVLF